MNTVFDFIEAVNRKIVEHLSRGGHGPVSVSISRSLYRRLPEMISADSAIGDLVIGSSPRVEIESVRGRLGVFIDEMLPDTEVAIA